MGSIRNDNLLRLFARVDEFIESRFDVWCGWRRHLHAHPELSWQEVQTTDFIRQQLKGMGLGLSPGPRQRGGFVDLQSPDKGGMRIAVRGDIDAIPVLEETDLEFRSQVEGVMHACGHDVHTTMALGVCETIQYILSESLQPAPLDLRVLFQPAEEVAQGAHEMIQLGAIQGVHRILAMHVDSSREVGCLGFRDGVQTACCEEVHVQFQGEGGHSARPHETSDPVFAAAQFINAAYSFIPRRTDPRRAEVLTFCQLSGGHSPNVIPTQVTIRGTLRSFAEETRQQVMQQLQDIAFSLGRSLGVQVTVGFGVGIPAVDNCVETNALMRAAAESFLPAESLTEVEPSLGGEDFSCYQQVIPGSLIRVGSACGNHGTAYLHSPHFDVDEEVIRVAVALFTRGVLQWAQSTA